LGKLLLGIEEDISDSKDNLINVFLWISSLLDAAADRLEPPPNYTAKGSFESPTGASHATSPSLSPIIHFETDFVFTQALSSSPTPYCPKDLLRTLCESSNIFPPSPDVVGGRDR